MSKKYNKEIMCTVEQLLEIAETAQRVEFTIAIDKGDAPTLSYKVDNLPYREKRYEDDV